MRAGVLLLLGAALSAQSWVPQESGTKASLRGLSAVNARIAWASGAAGTYLMTVDGGAAWRNGIVPEAGMLDFRGVHALDARTAYLMSIGPGDRSRIYKTIDGGAQWRLLFTNPDAQGFFDAIAFWDRRHGIVAGDPVDGHLVVFTTADGGANWTRQSTPAALPQEGAFAASNSCLVVRGKREVWLGTGGNGGARVLHSTDGGRTWNVATTPVRHDAPSAGIFSLAFSDGRHGVAVGGDYTKPEDAAHNIALTSDGGRSWSEPSGAHPAGFRSAVAYVAGSKAWIAAGTSGSDISYDGGQTWKKFDAGAYNALAVTSSRTALAAGPAGRMAALHLQ